MLEARARCFMDVDGRSNDDGVLGTRGIGELDRDHKYEA